MALTVLTPASTRRLTTLEHLEDDLGTEVVQANPDTFTRLIDRASAAVERFCGRIFAQQKYRETVRAARGVHLILRHTPIVSVTSITSDGESYTNWSIENAEAGILYSHLGWGWDTGVGSADAPFAWTIDYVAGFILPDQTTPPEATGETLPADVEAAVIEACKVWHAESLPEKRVVSRHFEDQTITYSIQAGRYGLPKLSQELLLASGWKRVAIA